MKEVLYLDVFFITNFVMDLVSLAVGGLAASEKAAFFRMVAAAFLGAAFSTAALILSWGKGLTLFLSFFSFFLMIRISFGRIRWKRLWKPALFSFATALFLGGAVEVISFYARPLDAGTKLTLGIFVSAVLCAFGLFSLLGKSLNRKLETAVVSLAIRFSGRCEHFFGLVDSGLLLKDPEGGRPVLLLKAEYASPLLPADFLCRLKKGDLTGEEKLFCIPIQTVNGYGELFAFMPESVSVSTGGGRKRRKEQKEVLVALDFSRGGFGGCPCLVPLSVL